MAAIDGNRPISTPPPSIITGVQPSTQVGTTGVPGGRNNVEQGSLSGGAAAGELSYAEATLNGTDWGALLESVQAANLSVTVTAIMVLLVEIMAQMKQDAREEAFTQAQAALAAGNLAAAEMVEAAKKNLAAAQVSASVQIVMGVASIAMGAYQLNKINNFNQTAKLDASRPNDVPLTRARSNAVTTNPEGAKLNAPSVHTPPKDFAVLQTQLQAQTQIFSGLQKLFEGSATLGAEQLKYEGALDSAEAQRAKADGEYQQALGQAAQAFMQQMADALKSYLNTTQSVEQAQHKATGAIYNC